MVAGFIADNVFFGRIDLWKTHAVFASYTLICFLTIPLLHRIESRAAAGIARPRWRGVLPIVTQFALGGFWSGLVIFYGRSAIFGGSWIFPAFLFLILLGNEYFRRYHDRLVFTSLLFFFALYSYAIFAVPIYTGSLGTLSFLESGALAIGIFAVFIALLHVFARTRFRADLSRIGIGAFAILILMNAFYFTNILPPLPLSAEAVGVYHDVWRVPGAYLAKSEAEPWAVRYLGFSPVMHVVPGESLSAYSAVFAPTTLMTTIVHRWQWYDPAEKQWVTQAVVPYPIVGGRDGGYRGYSTVRIDKAGEWRVSIETSDGRRIAYLPFSVEEVASPPEEQTITLQ